MNPSYHQGHLITLSIRPKLLARPLRPILRLLSTSASSFGGPGPWLSVHQQTGLRLSLSLAPSCCRTCMLTVSSAVTTLWLFLWLVPPHACHFCSNIVSSERSPLATLHKCPSSWHLDFFLLSLFVYLLLTSAAHHSMKITCLFLISMHQHISSWKAGTLSLLCLAGRGRPHPEKGPGIFL